MENIQRTLNEEISYLYQEIYRLDIRPAERDQHISQAIKRIVKAAITAQHSPLLHHPQWQATWLNFKGIVDQLPPTESFSTLQWLPLEMLGMKDTYVPAHPQPAVKIIVRNEMQNHPQKHKLISISSDSQRNIIDYLQIKELTFLMTSSSPFLQHFRLVFNNPVKETDKWQRFFHQRVACEAPWAELRCILRDPSILSLNRAVAIQSIINKSCDLFKGDAPCHSLTTLLNHCKVQQDLDNVESSLRTITARHTQAKVDKFIANEYYNLTQNLSFDSVAEFNYSVTALNDLYPYRILIKRRVGDHRLKRAINFPCGRDIVQGVRRENSQKWQSLLQARSGISVTILRGDTRAYQNWLKAEALVATRAEQCLPVTIEWLEEIHGVLSETLHNNGHPGGCCRPPHVQMYASETKRYYINGKYVRREMETFIEWLKNRLALHDREQQHQWHRPWIILTAAQASQWLVSIHPFGDANGRVSRFVMDYVLQRYGILPSRLSRWMAPVWGDNRPNVDEAHAITLVWDGIQESYRSLGLTD